eukprot:GHVS01078943.1.p1 GENE.GHVS01078943.1~~GHVS01078943.1.p1  ORF type:complete len:320 (+),score=68.60 GHVS01078943.1:168-1127(+)
MCIYQWCTLSAAHVYCSISLPTARSLLPHGTDSTGFVSTAPAPPLAVSSCNDTAANASQNCELKATLALFSGSPGPVYRLRDQARDGESDDILAALSSDGRRLSYTTASNKSRCLRSVEVALDGRVALGDNQTSKLTVYTDLSQQQQQQQQEAGVVSNSNDGRRIDSSSTKLRMAETVFFPALINYGEVQWQVEQSDPAAMNPLIATATAAAVVVDAASPQRPGKTLVGYVYTDDPSAVSQGVEVTASMNGKIVKLDVAEGTRVSKGDALAVIEAMKMESVVRAPVDGTVASVRVRPGDAVSQRQLLMSLLLPDDTAAK